MYIEFSIQWPFPGPNKFSPTALSLIRYDLARWSDKHKIPFKEKTIKDKHRVIFSDPENYTFFGLTFDPEYEASRCYKFVEPMKK